MNSLATGSDSEISAADLDVRGRACVAAGDYQQAEAIYRQCLVLEPDNMAWSRNLGLVLLALQKSGEARNLLKQAARTAPESFLFNALRENSTGPIRLDEVQSLLRFVTTVNRTFAPGFIELAEFSNMTGDVASAARYYKKALSVDPTHASALERCVGLLIDHAPQEGIALLDRAIELADDNWELRTKFLSWLVPYSEQVERAVHGLPRDSAANPTDLTIRFAMTQLHALHQSAAKWAEIDPEHPDAWINQAFAMVGLGRMAEAESYFMRARNLPMASMADPHNLAEVMTFDPRFYASLDSMTLEQIVEGLPALTAVKEFDFVHEHILYLSCSQNYFIKFCKPLLRSIASNFPAAQVHLHLMDATQDELASAVDFIQSLALTRFAISAETTPYMGRADGNSKLYYHAMRLVRLYQILRSYERTIWMMDVDALVHRDPTAIFEQISSGDIALRIWPHHLQPWDKFTAGCVGVRPTQAGLKYMKLVAASVAFSFRENRLRWGIDQLYLYTVFEFLRHHDDRPEMIPLDQRAADLDDNDESCIWFQSGKRKYSDRKQAESGSTPSGLQRERYVSELRKYI